LVSRVSQKPVEEFDPTSVDDEFEAKD